MPPAASFFTPPKPDRKEFLSMNTDILSFFDTHMDALSLYEALESRILQEIENVSIKVQKTQISSDRASFAPSHSLIIPDMIHTPLAPVLSTSSSCSKSGRIPPMAYTGIFTFSHTCFRKSNPLGGSPFLQSVA